MRLKIYLMDPLLKVYQKVIYQKSKSKSQGEETH